jgi:hypothetical protein
MPTCILALCDAWFDNELDNCRENGPRPGMKRIWGGTGGKIGPKSSPILQFGHQYLFRVVEAEASVHRSTGQRFGMLAGALHSAH